MLDKLSITSTFRLNCESCVERSHAFLTTPLTVSSGNAAERTNGSFAAHDSPRVSQICGMMQGPLPSCVSLVDVSSVLEQQLAGDQ